MGNHEDYLYDPRGEGIIENVSYYLSISVSAWFASIVFIRDLTFGSPVMAVLPLFFFCIYFAVLWKKKKFLMPRIPLGYRSTLLSMGKFFIYISSVIYLISILGLSYMLLFGKAGGISGVPVGIGLVAASCPSVIGIICIERVRAKAKDAFDEEII